MGHPEEVGLEELNNVCPYFTMFPLSFPAGVLRSARRGQTVIDPFCGRGTSLLAGRLKGLNAIGVDASPVAAAIASAKLVQTRPRDVTTVMKGILGSRRKPEVPDGEFWEAGFDPSTLRHICLIRESLLDENRAPARIALRAIMLGALHGPLRAEEPWYLSNQMPRTFASKPEYSLKYWRTHKLKAPKVNVADVVGRRANKYFKAAGAKTRGHVLNDDSRTCNLRELDPDARWIVTSPPYYGMRSYRPDQWLREWFLGGAAKVTYTNENSLSHASPEQFAHDLGLVWTNMASYCKKGAKMVVRFGGINDRPVNPRGIIQKSFDYASKVGWEFESSKSAGEPVPGRRQASQFARPLNSYVDERDYVAVLNA